jgi:hypothetical protein
MYHKHKASLLWLLFLMLKATPHLGFLKVMAHQCLVVSVKLEQQPILDLGRGNTLTVILRG